MATERHYFLSEARQEKTIDFSNETRRGMVLIRLQLFKLTGSGWMDGDAYEDVPVARDVNYEESPSWIESHFWINFSSLKHLPKRKKYTEIFADALEDWRVPKPQQPAIIAQLFQVVDGAAPNLSIVIAVRSLTLRLRIVSSFGYEAKELNPTAESSALVEEGLEKEGHDNWGATEHKTTCSCVLCLESFYESDSGAQKLTRLPCSHCYHGRCLLQWPSEISRFCPLCENSRSKWHDCRQFWVRMVRKHAATVISALVFSQFFKLPPKEPSQPTPPPPKSWRQSLLEMDERITIMGFKFLNDFLNKEEKEGEINRSQRIEKKVFRGSEATIPKDRNSAQMANAPIKGNNRHLCLFKPFSFVR